MLSSTKSKPHAARPLVVVADDDPSIRKALARLLRSAGMDVELFADAGEILAHVERLRPHCLVLDVHLAEMDGLCLLPQIVAADPGLPVVMITGDLDPELRTQALQKGAAAVLAKPLDEVKLLSEVRRALATRSKN